MKTKLNQFGITMMHNVYKIAIEEYDTKKINLELTRSELASWVDSLNDLERERLDTIIDQISVSVMQLFLEMIEECYHDTENEYRLQFVDRSGAPVDVRSLSDGLEGEMYGDDGWLQTFQSPSK
ncbi:MAG: hypothetical protein AAFR46_08275 [Pseudomonadota bacterium]